MTFIKKIHQLNRLHELIKRRATGSPKELAGKFDMSERCIYRLVDELRSFDLDIKYCRTSQSYIYTRQIDFSLSIMLNNQKINSLVGGNNFIDLLGCQYMAPK